MSQLYWNVGILLFLIVSIILIHYFGSKSESFKPTDTTNIYKSVKYPNWRHPYLFPYGFVPRPGFIPRYGFNPWINDPIINYFYQIPNGYDPLTRGYSNPYYANLIAQQLNN